MRVTLVHTHLPDGIGAPADAVAHDVTRRGLARALTARGHAVTVVQEAPFDAELAVDDVRWCFHRPSRATALARRALALAGDPHPIVRAPSDAPLDPVRASCPDVIHSFELAFYPSLALLGRQARRMGVPLVAHYHGGAPARRAWLRAAQRVALDHLDGACFTDVARAAAWGLRTTRVFDVLETSTELAPVPRDDARARVRARWGVSGDPLYACVARLDPVKDPLTVIRGFARLVAAGAPGSDPRLVMAYTDAPMESACRAEAERLGITTRVAFVGRVAGPALPMGARGPSGSAHQPDVAALLSAADAFVQASVREVCGVAVLEAAAVGALPVVTDLPVFRRNLGPHGARFPIGDDRALADALGYVDGRDEDARAALRAHFAAKLSFAAMAAEVESVYRALRA